MPLDLPDRPADDLLPEPSLPMLITGVTGVCGYNALDYFQAKYPGKVFGLRQPDDQQMERPDLLFCDATHRSELVRLFDKYRFRSVLDCAGNCALKPCEVNPEIAWLINVEGIRTLLHLTSQLGVRLVHLSIDLVYGGRGNEPDYNASGRNLGGDYTEDESPDPVTVYGRTMVEGERAVEDEDPTAATLRISLPMGPSFNGHAGAVDWIESRFKQNRPATLYFDEVRTPTYTSCMNRVFQAVLAGDLSGIYHAGGPRRVSLYQIAQIINRVGGYDPDLLFGMPRHHAGPIPPRAGNVTMNSSRLAEALGYAPLDPWPLCDEMMPDGANWHHERCEDEIRSPEHLFNTLSLHPLRKSS